MEYRAIYKCRLCGKEFEDACTCNKGLVFDCMIAMVCDTKLGQPLEPQKLNLHSCEDKSMGLADFQGWKAIDRESQTKKRRKLIRPFLILLYLPKRIIIYYHKIP